MMSEVNKQETAICILCKKDYSDLETELFYCLCDIAVCKNCISKISINATQWRCPICKKPMDFEKTQLFREVHEVK
jgi:hypothetical protein